MDQTKIENYFTDMNDMYKERGEEYTEEEFTELAIILMTNYQFTLKEVLYVLTLLLGKDLSLMKHATLSGYNKELKKRFGINLSYNNRLEVGKLKWWAK